MNFLINKNAQEDLNILFIGEYDHESDDYFSLFKKQLLKKTNLYVFKWESIYEDKELWTYKDVLKYVYEKIKILNIDFQKTIFIGHGIGATLLNQISNNLKPLAIALISPIFHTNYINPFTSRNPTYKDDANSFYQNLKKQFFCVNNFFESQESDAFVWKYRNYKKYFNFFETMRAQIGLFETLVYIKKNEKNIIKNNWIALGDHDFIVDKKESIKLISKNYFDNKISFNTFSDSAHYLMFEETKIFFSTLNDKIKEWTTN